MTDTETPKNDVVELVKAQHQEIKQLFDQVQRSRGDEQEEAFQCLVRLLAVHETAEEEIIHPVTRERDSDVVEQRLHEESEAKSALAELEDMGCGDERFPPALARLRSDVESHAEHEEQEELPLLGTDQQDQEHMALKFKAAEAVAPTHPHPHGPESKTGNLIVGPFAAVADRVKDAIKDAV